MKRFLTFKPPLIRSKTEKSTKNLDCLKATAHLAAVETAEYDTEAVPHKTRDARSLECNTCTTKPKKLLLEYHQVCLFTWKP